MADDAHGLKVPRLKKDSRKKKKNKRKKNPANGPHNTIYPDMTISPTVGKHSETNPAFPDNSVLPSAFSPATLNAHSPSSVSTMALNLHGSMSPRKQTLRRHEQTSKESKPCIISEAKKNMKPRVLGSSSAGSDAAAINGFLFSKQKMDGKTTLVTVPQSVVVVCHDSYSRGGNRMAPGTLLARGVLEIFQLHSCDVTYVSCGEGFVYPLLPKVTIVRTSENVFVLPLANPSRYWRFVLVTLDPDVIAKVESVLQSLVNYSSLLHEYIMLDIADARTTPNHTYNSTDVAATNGHLLSALFPEVPPSPPLVSVSPPPTASGGFPPFDLNATLDSSLPDSNIVAGYSKPAEPFPSFLQAPNPRASQFLKENAERFGAKNLDKLQDAHEVSSMDSLLDEYEETLSATRSVYQESSSRMLSLHYVNHHSQSRELPLRLTNHHRSVDCNWGQFLKAAGRLQPRRMTPSHGGRSRKSSTSNLYTSVSSWMDPGKENGTITHSKSMRSFASRQSSSAPKGLFEAYRQIPLNGHTPFMVERSLSSRSLSLTLLPVNAPPLKAASPQVPNKLKPPPEESPLAATHRSDGLTPSVVYDLIRNRDNTVKPKVSGLRGFFGW